MIIINLQLKLVSCKHKCLLEFLINRTPRVSMKKQTWRKTQVTRGGEKKNMNSPSSLFSPAQTSETLQSPRSYWAASNEWNHGRLHLTVGLCAGALAREYTWVGQASSLVPPQSQPDAAYLWNCLLFVFTCNHAVTLSADNRLNIPNWKISPTVFYNNDNQTKSRYNSRVTNLLFCSAGGGNT